MNRRFRLPRPVGRWILKLDCRDASADQRIRCRVVLKVAAGLSCSAAARELGGAPSTAVRVAACSHAARAAASWDQRYENELRKLGADGCGGVCEIMTASTRAHGLTRPLWILELLRTVLETVLRVALSLGPLRALLRRTGASWGRPRPIVACPTKVQRRQPRLSELQQVAAAATEQNVGVYADKVDLHPSPMLGPGWMPPPSQPLSLTPGRKETRQLSGAYEPRGQRLLCVECDGKADGFSLSTQRALLRAYAYAQMIHLILDKYFIRKSRVTQARLAEFGARLRLHFVPAYCPNENRVERDQFDLHANGTRDYRHRTAQRLSYYVHDNHAERFDTRRRVLLVGRCRITENPVG